ncbi:MAG: RNA 2',3'-cyclic phosphodiesterase [Gammaproteobacteria bacterium]
MTPTGATRRIFVALWPDDAVRARLAGVGAEWFAQGAPHSVAPRLVPAGNLHLTLAFIGACSESCLHDVAGAADRCARQHQEVTLTLDHGAWFRRPRVGWLGPRKWPRALDCMVADLRSDLDQRGVAHSAGPFRPHVTLARKVSHRPPQAGSAPITWVARDIGVVESVSTPEGVRYQLLSHHLLQINTRGANTV